MIISYQNDICFFAPFRLLGFETRKRLTSVQFDDINFTRLRERAILSESVIYAAIP